MSVDVLTASVMPAESLADRLTHWHVLDIVHVARNGNLQLCAVTPWRPTKQLIQWNVLKYASGVGKYRILVPGHRFLSVLCALERSGRIAKHERAVL